MFVSRDISVQLIGFATSLVLARLLSPAYFGITTLGLTILTSANIIADGGIAAWLIARKENPTSAEMGAVNGFQLLLTMLVAAVALPVGFAVGGDGPATAVIMLALPFYALRTPPLLLLERRLQFAPRIFIQLAELIVYAIVAIALAVGGLGLWAMPVALVLRSIAGTLLALHVNPGPFVRPSLAFGPLKPLLGFGMRFQARNLIQLARDLTSVSVVGAVGGFLALGYYGFCTRLLSIPQSAGTSLGEVTLPAFSRLIGNGEDVGPLLERSTGTLATFNAILIAPLVAASPGLIPLVFGQRWQGASLMLPGMGLGLIVGGPLGWTIVNYLYAKGDARTPLWVTGVLNSVFTVVCTGVLAAKFGSVGVGMGRAAGPLIATPFLLLRVRRMGGPTLWRVFLSPAASASCAMAVGWWLCRTMHDTLAGSLAALSAALIVEVALLSITNRAGLVSCFSTLRRLVGTTLLLQLRPAAAEGGQTSRAHRALGSLWRRVRQQAPEPRYPARIAIELTPQASIRFMARKSSRPSGAGGFSETTNEL